MKAQDWRDWLNSPVTKAVIAQLEEVKDDKVNNLLKIQGETLDDIAIKHVAIRSELSGLGEFLDLDTLAEGIGVTNED